MHSADMGIHSDFGLINISSNLEKVGNFDEKFLFSIVIKLLWLSTFLDEATGL